MISIIITLRRGMEKRYSYCLPTQTAFVMRLRQRTYGRTNNYLTILITHKDSPCYSAENKNYQQSST